MACICIYNDWGYVACCVYVYLITICILDMYVILCMAYDLWLAERRGDITNSWESMYYYCILLSMASNMYICIIYVYIWP